MIVRNSFPIPEDPPAVPEQLLDKVHDAMREELSEVDVMRAQSGGWMVVNNVKIEKSDTPTQVAEMVKMCGDRDAETRAESSKYRAQMWLGDGKSRDAVRRYCTFSVVIAGDESEGGRARVSTEWREVYEQQSTLIDKLSAFNMQLMETNVARAKEDGVIARDFHGVIQGMVQPYREGVQLKNDAIMSVLRAKMDAERERTRAEAALAGADGDNMFWEQMQPVISATLAQVASKMGIDMLALPASSNKQPVKAKPAAKHAHDSASGTPRVPLHAQGREFLDGLGAATFLQLMSILTDDQRQALQAIATATDDRTSAHAVMVLMGSLMKQPGILMQMNQALGADQVKKIRQLAALAKEINDTQK